MSCKDLTSVKDENFFDVAFQTADSVIFDEVLNLIGSLVTVVALFVTIILVMIWNNFPHKVALRNHNMIRINDIELDKRANSASVVFTRLAPVVELVTIEFFLTTFITLRITVV
jgi:hypothetical protein